MLKRAGKIVLYLILSLLILIVVLVVVAAFSENKIARLALDQLGKSTNIPFQVDKIEFSLIRNFPMATIECKQLTVLTPPGAKVFANDTLFHTGEMFVSVNVKPLFHGFFDIRELEFNKGKAYYKVDTAGFTNIDFLNDTTSQAQPDTSSASFSLNLKELAVSDLACIYSDQQKKMAAQLKLNSLRISGHFEDSDYRGKGDLKAVLSGLHYPGTNAHLMQQTMLEFEGSLVNDSLEIDRAKINIDDDAKLTVSGNVVLNDSLWSNLLIQAEKLDIGQLAKYVPDSLFENYGVKKAQGIVVADASIKGNLASTELPSVEAAFRISDGRLKYQDYSELRNISTEGEINNGEKQTLADTFIQIKKLSFRTDSSRFSLKGWVRNLDKPAFNIQSDLEISLNEVARFIPDSLVQNPSGRINVNFSTKGVLPDSISDAFIQTMLNNSQMVMQLQGVGAAKDSSMNVSGLSGRIEYKPDTIRLIGVEGNAETPMIRVGHFAIDANVLGNPLNPDSLFVDVKNLNAELDSSQMQLQGRVSHLSNPDYTVEGEINLNLADFKNFIPDSMFTSVSGKVRARFRSSAVLNLDSLTEQMMEIVMTKSLFQIDLQSVSALSSDSLMNVEDLTGSLNYRNDTFDIKQFSAKYLGMKIQMEEVSAAQVYAGALQNQAAQIDVHGKFFVDTLDYDRLAVFMEEPSQSSGGPANYSYKINGSAHLDQFKYEKAIFRDIDTRFLVMENYYVVDSMTMNGFDGIARTSAKVEMQDSARMTLWFKTDMKNMNVTQLVDAFGDYMDYDEIQKNNVQGTISAVMDGKIVLKDFEPDYNEMSLKGDLTLKNGALFNVKPVMEVQNISGVGIKNLDSLYFSTINSSLFLFRNDLYIPRTEIQTSSFDAMFLGMYSFGEDYAYHIRLFLGEVLSSKSKAHLRKQAQEGGFSEEDEKDLTKGRTAIYVVSKSENGKEKAGFDTKKDRLNMVARVNLQEQMLNMRFHPTLVSYDTEQ